MSAGESRVAPFRADLAGGAAAATLGMVSFGVFHTIWIRNIPGVFIEGILYVIPAAFALAWAIRATKRAGRFREGRPWTGIGLGFLVWLTVVPYEIVGAIWGPWEEPASFGDALPVLWIAFLGVPVGAAIGWTITRRLRPALAWAVAALTVNFSLGGAIAFFGGQGRFFGLFLWLLPTHLAAGALLVGVPARLHPHGGHLSADAAVTTL